MNGQDRGLAALRDEDDWKLSSTASPSANRQCPKHQHDFAGG